MLLGILVNADFISKEMETSHSKLTQFERDKIAQQEVIKRRVELVDQGKSFSVETVMSHHSHLDFLKYAMSKGYYVRLVFVATEDPQINVYRVNLHVKNGGHDVDDKTVVSRYFRSIALLIDVVGFVDQCLIYDNSLENKDAQLLGMFDNGKYTSISNKEKNWFLSAYDRHNVENPA